MKITVNYFAQARRVAGVESEIREARNDITVLELLQEDTRSPSFTKFFFGADRKFNPTILVVVNELTVPPETKLHDGDNLCFFTPMSGG